MKNFPVFILLFICLLQNSCDNKIDLEISNNRHESADFDPKLASKLGADEFGMKKYVMAFLKKGPNRDHSEQEAQDLQIAHMENIGKLASEGKLVLAGPYLDDGDLRGIYIFDTDNLQIAENWTKTDPAIQAGSLVLELHPWYGSAALMMINDWHPKLAQKEI